MVSISTPSVAALGASLLMLFRSRLLKTRPCGAETRHANVESGARRI